MVSTEVSSYRKNKDPYNQWKETVKFFNSKVGQQVTRSELRQAVKHRPRSHYPLTIDNYRALLESSEYIKHIGRGTYFVVRQIPDVSSSLVKEYVERKRKPFGWFKFWGTLEDYIDYWGK